MAFKHNFSYEIPSYIFDMVLEELDPTEWTIWDPFPRTGRSVEHIKSRGYEVIQSSSKPFFNLKRPPLPSCGRKLAVVTVPPLKLKRQAITKLNELEIEHLAIFLPTGTLTYQYFNESLARAHKQQLIIHQLQCPLLDRHTYKPLSNAPFTVLWFSFGLNFKEDIQYKVRNRTHTVKAR